MRRQKGIPIGAQVVSTDTEGRHPQNSIRPSNAIMRGEVSPPSPTPSSPIGGEVVLCSVPNLYIAELERQLVPFRAAQSYGD